ncbi:hypothetical protein PFTANZ_06489, partial [Plasmodium falciparum Tanzania (2000708)]
YLRWFEEWAEDFCRKKKHKLKDAIQKCRKKDNSSEERYCDLNGYDCEKTKRGRNKYRWDHKCTGCFRSCSHFVNWIDNQKQQFLKQKEQFDEQKKKYINVINGASVSRSRKRRGTTTTNYDGYESKFYDKLKDTNYKNVENFLKKLNDEDVCKKITDEKEGTIHFEKVNSASSTSGDGSNKTFDHTEYCQACPWCGVKKQNGTWKRKEDMDKCQPKNLYKPESDDVGTLINFLYSGDEETEIEKKLKEFCKIQNGSDGSGGGGGGGNSDSQDLADERYKSKGVDDEDDDLEYENEVKSSGGLCILKKEKKGVEETNPQNNHADIQKTFNPFFYYWVVHMLKDSIHWRTKRLKSCISNGTTMKCRNGCH